MRQQEAIAKAIEELENVRSRPILYLGTSSVQAIQNWLSGFKSACYVFGLSGTLEISCEATYKRGWEFTATGPANEMREQGYTEEQVVDELLMIEITSLQMLAALPEASA